MRDAWREMLGTGCLTRDAWHEKMVVEHSSTTIEEQGNMKLKKTHKTCKYMTVLIGMFPDVGCVAFGRCML